MFSCSSGIIFKYGAILTLMTVTELLQPLHSIFDRFKTEQLVSIGELTKPSYVSYSVFKYSGLL